MKCNSGAAFSSCDVEGYTKYFQEHGYVVVEGMLTEDEVKATLDEVSTISSVATDGVIVTDPT